MSADSNYTELARLITRLVADEIAKGPRIILGVSNHHVHLSRDDMDALFGKNSELTPKKMLIQPGQFAAQETVTIRGPKGEIKNVRVLGPLRSETQVEISCTDGFMLGIKPPVRESGSLDGTPGIEIIGPCGQIKKERGVIAALRHIHMHPKTANIYGFKDKEIVNVEINSPERPLIFKNVLLRVSNNYRLEMHIDTDEANASGASTGCMVRITRPCHGK